MLGRPPSAVRLRLHRARKRLAKELDSAEPDGRGARWGCYVITVEDLFADPERYRAQLRALGPAGGSNSRLLIA
ncbi:hypothetical protein Aph01nite_18660 [Acrocarpospora phusangensis]|uniref:Uncharacterized protein n=1 Tax=Acrocarpospora phusangensis TaxID=1070424 RepID=A0A919Q8N8_9ACTN|nr:hypothetical protein Aph01nite_18660 [Acrocarpospora phusangensis]